MPRQWKISKQPHANDRVIFPVVKGRITLPPPFLHSQLPPIVPFSRDSAVLHGIDSGIQTMFLRDDLNAMSHGPPLVRIGKIGSQRTVIALR